MGCSRELISLISRISFLTTKLQPKNIPYGSTRAMACNLMNQLSQLQQVPQARAENVGTMILIAEVKRLSAMLYLHDRAMVLWSTPGLEEMSPLAKNLQNRIIQTLQILPASSGAALWPLFVLGNSTLENDEQIRFVLKRLHQLEISRNLGSVHYARRRVERSIMASFTTHETSMIQPYRHVGGEVLNDNEKWVSLA